MPHFASSVRRQPLLRELEIPVVAAGHPLRLPNSVPPRGKVSLLPRPDQPSRAPRWNPREAATTEREKWLQLRPRRAALLPPPAPMRCRLLQNEFLDCPCSTHFLCHVRRQ